MNTIIKWQNLSNFSKTIISGLLSGIALGLSFTNSDDIPYGIISWFAFIPFLLMLRHTIYLRQFIALVLSVIIPWVSIAVWWIVVPNTFAGILLLILIIILLFLHFLPVWLIKKSLGWKLTVLTFPVFWAAWEWINMQFPFSSGWLIIAHTHSTFWRLNQIVDLLGIWGLSFWIITINIGVVLLIDQYKDKKKSDIHFFGALPKIVIFLCVMVGILWIYSYEKTDGLKSENYGITVSIIQPNVNPNDKWNKKLWDNQFKELIYMTDVAIKEANPDLVVWPEMAIPWFILDDPDSARRKFLEDQVKIWDVNLIFGFPDVEDSTIFTADKDSVSNELVVYNSAALITPDNGINIFHKKYLLPFVETVLFVNEFPFMENLRISLGLYSFWKKGETSNILRFKTRARLDVLAGIGICYEQIYPSFTVEAVHSNANLLIFITNDGWFKKTPMLTQAANISRLRAIETGRSLIRCGNNGISHIVDRFGRIVALAPVWEPFLITQNVKLENASTFYSREPDLFVKICTLLGGIILLISIVILARSRKKLETSEKIRTSK